MRGARGTLGIYFGVREFKTQPPVRDVIAA
jgi:hypothetical protein